MPKKGAGFPADIIISIRIKKLLQMGMAEKILLVFISPKNVESIL
jgi:hypothetical protein